MALVTNTRSLMGKGSVKSCVIVNGVKAGALLEISNSTALEIKSTGDKKTVPEMRYLGGGSKDSYTRLTEVTGSVTFTDFSVETLEKVLRTSNVAIASSAVVDEAHDNVYAGEFVPFNKIPDSGVAYVVKKGATTLDVGDDYIQKATGIQLVAGGAVIDGDDILVSYTANKSTVLEAFQSAAVEYQLYFEGLNEIDGGNPIPVTLYRVKFDLLDTLPLIADEPGTLTATFECLSLNGKFFKIGMVENA